MTPDRAITIALKAMGEECDRLRIAAIGYDMYGRPSAKRASQEHKAMLEAMRVLEAMKTRQEVMELG